MYRVRLVTTVAILIGILCLAGPSSAERITYSKDVAPIFNEKCIVCHRTGQIAPMSLTSYDEVRPWAKSIRKNVADKKMPPWQAVEHVGEFTNDRSLSKEEIDTIVAWIDQGASRGKYSDLPPTPKFSDAEWELGEPDFIVTLPEVHVPAEGRDVFKNLAGTLSLPEDRWLRAIEVLPGNRKVLHHTLVFQLKGFDFEPDEGWLGAWAAGAGPLKFPEGTGRLLRKGSNILGDMHYHPCGTPESDITRIGLYFIEEESIEKELTNLWILNTGFQIPAGAANHEVTASYTINEAGYIWAFAPHMHYRGKDFSYIATYPDGSEELLLKVDNYDFNWQTNYELKEAFFVPEGTRIDCVAHFDNSADNPANPDPTIDITFGEESYDEMMIGFIDFVVKDGFRPETAREARARLLNEMSEKYKSDLYAVIVKGRDDRAPLYLPRDGGDGRMYFSDLGMVKEGIVEHLSWNGSSFTATVTAPGYGTYQLSGSIDLVTGKLEAVLIEPDGDRQRIHGERLSTGATGTD